MNKGRTVLGLCVAAALLVSAFAAQSASAETTEFTCSKSVTTKTWSDAHCTNSSTGTKEYGHVAIPENTTTDAIGGAGTSFEGEQKLRASINGINVELVSKSVSGTGSVKNTTVGGKMRVEGTGTSTLTNVTVQAPASKGCKVFTDNGGVKGEEGVIHTNELKVVTTEEMGLKTEPVATSFATFFIGNCAGSEALEGLNKTYEITGSVIGEPSGGEGIFTHAATTAQNTLKLNGTIKLGINGSGTVKARHAEKPEEEYKAITVTTPPYTTD
jgi:hypothetical protein